MQTSKHEKVSISVVIPVYNSENSIKILCDRIERVLKNLSDEFEVIFINDNSQDGSWENIVSLVEKHSWIHGINLMRNYGQHNALLSGIRAAKYNVVVTMDDDLQHPPEEIPKLINKLNEGYDVVYGTPLKQQHGFFRNFASNITKYVLKKIIGLEIAQKVSAFRAFRTSIRDSFSNFYNMFISIDVLLTWGTSSFSYVAVNHEPRTFGVSRYTLFKLIVHTFNMVTGYSILPLQVTSLLGLVFTFVGFLLFLYVIIIYLFQGNPVQGFPFLASIIIIFSGVQLFTLGIIGEYIARIYSSTLHKPPYMIKEKTK